MMDFYSDLITALGQIPNLNKSGFNPHFKANFVPLEEVMNVIRPILYKNNLGVLQDHWIKDDCLYVQTTLLHKSGKTLKSSEACFVIQDKKPQALGSLLTYSRRYQLFSFFCLAGDSDLDSQASTETGISKALASAKALKMKQIEESNDDL